MKKPILRSTLLAALLAAMAGQAHAAGLGRISVLSGLGQPLRAEVEVAATPEELDTLSAKMASADAFKRANIEYVGALSNVRMSIERRPTGAVVRMSSDRAFNEPFVDLLLELNWAGGRLLREYTFLLDPVSSSAPTKGVTLEPGPIISAPVVQQAKPLQPRRSVPTAPADAPRVNREVAAAPRASSANGGDYQVKNGDNLSVIAAQTKSDDVSQQQMIAALYQANSDAFIGGNINRLRSGRLLKVPEAAVAKQISSSEAREIILKASNFGDHRTQVATAAAGAAARDSASGQSSSGKIVPRVEEPVAAAAGQDKLKIGKTQVDKQASDKGASARVQALEEDIVSRDKALKEANSRLAALEKSVKDLQGLVELKNKNLADLQKRATDADLAAKEAQKKADAAAKNSNAQTAATAKVDAKKAADDAKLAAAEAKKAEEQRKAEEAKRIADEKKAEEQRKVDDAKRLAEEQKAEEIRKAEEAKQLAEAEKAKKEAAAGDAASRAEAARLEYEARAAESEAEFLASQSTPAVAAVPATGAQSESSVAPAPAEPTSSDEGPVSPSSLLGLLLGAAAIGGGLLLWRRRQQRAKAAGFNTTALSEASTSPNSVFGNAGGQTVDTGTSVLHTDFSQSGLSAIDTDEGVDPVAEADVYMAYGRDAQAEEILLDALKNDPSRGAIYVKLLEIYAQRKSVKQFENIASDLFTQTGGAGEDWAKAAALGLKLDPNNPLYRGSSAVIAPTVVDEIADNLASAGAVAAAPVQSVPDAPAAKDNDDAVSFGTNNVSQMRATWTVPGDIEQYSQDSAGNTVADIPASENVPESLNLDFNLDLEMPEDNEPETRMESRDIDEDDILHPLKDESPAQAVDENAPLEFDMDMGSSAPVEEKRLEATEPEGFDGLLIDEPVPSSFAPSSLSDADLGIERDVNDDDGLAEVDLEKTNFEGSLLDFDFELGDESKLGTSMPDRSLDLSSLNPLPDTSPASSAQGGSSAATSVAPSHSEELPEVIDIDEEVSTKLELARAYEEMGDMEGARELLDEVVADGASTQQEEARKILSRLT